MRVLRFLVAFSALFLVASQAQAKCGDNVGDEAAVAAARAAANAACDCDSFTNHGQYVKCVKDIAIARTKTDPPLLPKNCKGSVIKCAAKSTCGKPGFVTCCKTSSTGKVKCSTKPNASKCTPPSNGSACVSGQSSCCDACLLNGDCVPSPSGAFLDGAPAGF